MESNFHFNDELVKEHQERLMKQARHGRTTVDLDVEAAPAGRIRTMTGNLLIRWGERVSGCERRAAANAAPGRLAS